MKRLWICGLGSVALIVLVFCLSQAATAQLVLYDNFNSNRINPAKWGGWQTYDPDLREAVRELAPQSAGDNGHRLHLMQMAYSAVTDDSGGSGGIWGLTFPNPGAVTAVSFEVTVNKIAVTSCASNSGFEAAAAEFRGGFFNTQNSPTSSIGDVLGDISVVRNVQDLGNALTGAGFISECTDQFCGAQTTLVYQVLGNVNAGSTNVLSIRWDQRNHQFIFRLNHNSPVYAPYNVADISPPFSASKTIGLARVVTHCTSSPRPYALVDAHFDNVYVNP